MKLTKEMLADMRVSAMAEAFLGETDRDFVREYCPLEIEPEALLALLDERKALRAEVRALYDGEGANWQNSQALALGEDEE